MHPSILTPPLEGMPSAISLAGVPVSTAAALGAQRPRPPAAGRRGVRVAGERQRAGVLRKRPAAQPAGSPSAVASPPVRQSLRAST